MKQYDQSSPRSIEVMIGCVLSRACWEAWRLGEESQQPTLPQLRQTRRCTHWAPIARQSSQPSVWSGRRTVT